MNNFVIFTSPLKTIISLYLLKTKKLQQIDFGKLSLDGRGIEDRELSFAGCSILLFKPWTKIVGLICENNTIHFTIGRENFYTFLVDRNGNLLWDPLRYYITKYISSPSLGGTFEIKDKVTGDKGILGKDGKSVILWGIKHIACFFPPKFILPPKGHGFYAKSELQMSDGSKKYITQNNKIKTCGI